MNFIHQESSKNKPSELLELFKDQSFCESMSPNKIVIGLKLCK